MTNRTTHGFTLVELLVVIAIIALLLALFVPSFSDIMAKARQMQCAANLHEIGKAYALRGAQESQMGTEPMSVDNWAYALSKQADGVSDIFYCPEGPWVPGGHEAVDLTEYYCESFHEYMHPEWGYIHLPDIDTLEVEPWATRNKWSLWWWLKERDDNHFVLGLEDQAQNGGYQDLVYRFDYVDEGIKVTYILNQSSWKHYLHAPPDPNGEAILGPMGGGAGGEQIPYGTSVVIAATCGTNYGMNSLAVGARGGKETVLVLDYAKPVARCAELGVDEDFSEHVEPRHDGKCNVLFPGGGVKLMSPGQIDPDQATVAERYWQP